jgi:hypothetical protein
MLLTETNLPPTPAVAEDGPLDASGLSVHCTVKRPGGEQREELIEWRLADVTSEPNRRGPRRYEIEPVWRETGADKIQIPRRLLEPGRTYRVRARLRNAMGWCGHWSTPLEVTPGKKSD